MLMSSSALLLTDYTCCSCFAWSCRVLYPSIHPAAGPDRRCILVHRSTLCHHQSRTQTNGRKCPFLPSFITYADKQSTTRSPLFISFSEALVGMSTIRSYGDSARFMRKIFRELDSNTRCFWYLWQTNRVLHNFSNFTGSLVTIFACVFALRNREMSAGAVGFSISYARMSPLFYEV
jgi:ABC-type multidrug transport system fused ATPase/permease subunit